MSRYKKTSASYYDKLVKEGRGQGRGANYMPWITVRDVPSVGLSSRVPGWITGRIHHFLSILELSYFYCLEWSQHVTDIREQYPLPMDVTLDIAERLGIRHPFVNHLNDFSVMTTDFLIDVSVNGQPRLLARSIKPEIELASKRTVEKILIEKTYWEEIGIDFKVVTEKEINKNLAHNIEFVYTAKRFEDSPGVDFQTLTQAETVLYTAAKDSRMPLAKTALSVDRMLGFEAGTSLWIIKHLIANHIWLIDMTRRIDTSKPLLITRGTQLSYKEPMIG